MKIKFLLAAILLNIYGLFPCLATEHFDDTEGASSSKVHYSSLAQTPLDILNPIVNEYLSSKDIMRLYMTGDSILRRHLTNVAQSLKILLEPEMRKLSLAQIIPSFLNLNFLEITGTLNPESNFDVSSLVNLRTIKFSGNKALSLLLERNLISFPPQITRLVFNSCSLRSVPQGFFAQFRALEDLNLSKNSLNPEVQDEIMQASNITSLNLSLNGSLEYLPARLSNLPSLKALDVSGIMFDWQSGIFFPYFLD